MGAWSYLVVIGICLIGFAWLMPKRQSHSGAPTLADIEETLESFSAELEEENKQFAEWLAGFKTAYDKRLEASEQRIHALEKQNELLQSLLVKEWRQEAGASASAESAAVADAPVEPAARESAVQTAVAAESAAVSDPAAPADSIAARYPELFQYYRQGKSTEQIARKLGMNKGEVMLILGLARREEQRHVQS